MQTIRALLCLALAIPAFSQFTSTARHIGWGASLPATCRVTTGDVFFLTSGSIGVYYCSATNTWSITGTGGAPGGPAGGILSGIYPNPAIAAGANLGTPGTLVLTNAIGLPFSSLASATNSAAAMVCGTGCSIGVSGSGTNNATSLGGAAAALYALLAGPTFTGVPAAPTAAASDNTTQLATDAFVNRALQTTVPLKCYDTNAAHTQHFTCTTSPSFTPVAGSLILFRFAADNNIASSDLSVNGATVTGLTYGSANVPANFLNGDAFGPSATYYVLTYDDTFPGWMVVGPPPQPPLGGNGLTTTNCIPYRTSTSNITCDSAITRPAAGTIQAALYATATNCANGASPAACGAAPAGAVAIPTGVTTVTLVVNTTAVTANSRIKLQADDSVTIAATTCNNTLATLSGGLAVTARTAGTSFTITYNGTIATNPLCVSYFLVD